MAEGDHSRPHTVPKPTRQADFVAKSSLASTSFPPSPKECKNIHNWEIIRFGTFQTLHHCANDRINFNWSMILLHFGQLPQHFRVDNWKSNRDEAVATALPGAWRVLICHRGGRPKSNWGFSNSVPSSYCPLGGATGQMPPKLQPS